MIPRDAYVQGASMKSLRTRKTKTPSYFDTRGCKTHSWPPVLPQTDPETRYDGRRNGKSPHVFGV